MQLPQIGHRFVAEILREGVEPLTTALDLDWIPAVEWGRFQQIRNNSPARVSGPEYPRIRPAWDRATGAPYVSHVEVSFATADADGQTIPLRYFTAPVAHAVSALIKDGRINAGEKYRWRICAYPGPEEKSSLAGDDSFVIEESQVTDSAFQVISLDTLLARARYHGPPPADGEQPDVSVLFAPQVLTEAAEIATAADTLEAGGILLGRLGRDAASGELALEVVAQIAAREAIASDASLRFTPETWRAVDAAIRLRGGGEQILGWWHSHPQALWPCKNCPPERHPTCPSNQAFFSAMDVGFHRTAFQAAHNVALLLSFHADPTPRFDLFGWRHGMVSARGYYIKEMKNEH